MFRLTTALLIATLSGLAAAAPGDQGRWLDGKSDGWFWYNEEPEPEEEKEEEQKPEPPKPAPPPAEPQPPKGPAPLSSAWIRENIQAYLDVAIDNPTPENIAAYLYIQKHAMDKSFAFMDATQAVTLGNADFDAISERPTATLGVNIIARASDQRTEELTQKIGTRAGLFFFIDHSPASRVVADTLDSLVTNYQYDIITIAVTRLPEDMYREGMKMDNGHAQQMGIKTYPALVLVRADGTYDVISQAMISYTDLKKRILLGAKRLGIITKAEYDSTRPMGITPEANQALPMVQNNDYRNLPFSPEQIIQAFNGGNTP